MKYSFFSLFFAFFVSLLGVTPQTNAQEAFSAPTPSILAPNSIEAGQSFSLEAVFLTPPEKNVTRPTFNWDFGQNEPLLWGKRIKYTYNAPGAYKIRLSVKYGTERFTSSHKITVFNKKMALISQSVPPQLSFEAANMGVRLQPIIFTPAETNFATQSEFIQTLTENQNTLLESSHLVFVDNNTTSFQIFAEWWRRLSDEKQDILAQKNYIFLSQGAFSSISSGVRRGFEVIRPEKILIIRPESISSLWQTSSTPELIESLSEKGLPFQEIDARYAQAWYLPLSRAVTYFTRNGVTEPTLYLLLCVPFLAFFVTFARQFVGIKTFGVYTPVMLGLSFLVLGFKFGLLAFLMVLLVSTAIRWVFSRITLLYIPKVSLTLSTLALSFILVLALGIKMKTSVDLSMSIFPMLVLITVSEKFLSNQSAAGLKSAFINTAETTVIALLSALFLAWQPIQLAILATPEWVIVPLALTLWLGQFTGLRLMEYVKFKALFESSEE